MVTRNVRDGKVRVVTLSPTNWKFRPEIWYALTEEAR